MFGPSTRDTSPSGSFATAAASLLISAAATMRQRDLLDPSKFVPVAMDGHRSDGRRLWPTPLGYYLRTYRVALPDSLLSHGRARGWAPVPKEKVDVRVIAIAMIRARPNPAPSADAHLHLTGRPCEARGA